VAGVRVGYIPGEDVFLVNPSVQDQQRSVLDLVLAGTRDSILMIEGFCDFLTGCHAWALLRGMLAAGRDSVQWSTLPDHKMILNV